MLDMRDTDTRLGRRYRHLEPTDLMSPLLFPFSLHAHVGPGSHLPNKSPSPHHLLRVDLQKHRRRREYPLTLAPHRIITTSSQLLRRTPHQHRGNGRPVEPGGQRHHLRDLHGLSVRACALVMRESDRLTMSCTAQHFWPDDRLAAAAPEQGRIFVEQRDSEGSIQTPLFRYTKEHTLTASPAFPLALNFIASGEWLRGGTEKRQHLLERAHTHKETSALAGRRQRSARVVGS